MTPGASSESIQSDRELGITELRSATAGRWVVVQRPRRGLGRAVPSRARTRRARGGSGGSRQAVLRAVKDGSQPVSDPRPDLRAHSVSESVDLVAGRSPDDERALAVTEVDVEAATDTDLVV